MTDTNNPAVAFSEIINYLFMHSVQCNPKAKQCQNIDELLGKLRLALEPDKFRDGSGRMTKIFNELCEKAKLPFALIYERDSFSIYVKPDFAIYIGDDENKALEFSGRAQINLERYLEGCSIKGEMDEESAAVMFKVFTFLHNLAFRPAFYDDDLDDEDLGVDGSWLLTRPEYLIRLATDPQEVYDREEINYICRYRYIPYQIRVREGRGRKFYRVRKCTMIDSNSSLFRLAPK